MRWPWFKTPEPALIHDPSVLERVKVLESDFNLLRHDWEEVLDRLTRRVARDVAAKRKALVSTIETVAAESPAEGEPEAAVVSKAELWARLRSKRA
jgi:hypothetical protein